MIHAELYPLAFWRGASDALAGLGLRFTAQLPQWGDIKQQSQVGGATTGSVSATERRLEVGLRWHLNPWDRVLRPDFELEALYGDHLFGFSNPINPDLRQPADCDLPLHGRAVWRFAVCDQLVAARGGFLFSKHLSLGSMTTVGVDADGNSLREQNGYQSHGPGNGWMWRTDWSATGHIWRGIHAGFAFFFEQNKLSFDGKGNIYQTSGMPVVRAQDEYLGVMLTVGYAFQGKRNPRPTMTAGETSDTAPATSPPRDGCRTNARGAAVSYAALSRAYLSRAGLSCAADCADLSDAAVPRAAVPRTAVPRAAVSRAEVSRPARPVPTR